jgi:hypothetical protein
LDPWEGSVTRRDDVAMSTGGKAAPERGNGGDDASWTYTNLTMSKNKKVMWSIQLLQMTVKI